MTKRISATAIDMETKKSKHTSDNWSVHSYKDKVAKQQPEYPDQQKLENVLKELECLPPLVHTGEIDQLRAQLKEVADGKRFLLQGGDCAELFAYCNKNQIENKVKIMLQMSLILTHGAHLPIVRIARIAGQYGKPRSSPTEIIDGETFPSFRGENVNGMEKEDRTHDPQRLLKAYFHSAATLNYIRALVHGGFADIRKPENWELSHVEDLHTRQLFEGLSSKVQESLEFMKKILNVKDNEALRYADFYSSHEGLILDYEAALTRVEGTGEGAKHYNTSAHYIWIGDRTREITGAHIEYFRGIANPIGVKCGPSMEPEELVRLIRILDPDQQAGRLSIITRYGHANIKNYLPAHIKAVQEAGLKVVWVCDPMHGNTESSQSGYKTRSFDNVLSELRSAFNIHKEHRGRLGGVHFELTGDNVTECTGGSENLKDTDLGTNYETFCDPRLNYGQSMDMAFLIADYFNKARATKNSMVL
ncbi:3-deoxy-7-phosphoheptulonate synthase [Sphaeroforma arctica JP610]|uniref:Phospho-2-dehydro-3-deoxyheptonate aldolase n=1 Tax=Sphaeroforma arctica JP610 TaxID=667725 RepID=A0A0L0FJ62_9EUKA|nr:3-deoxy-7-phosphoheptulonate synthase [Sphaeroforma arctica JP610]KNC76817.1 3-deoxy-7-phosphoheptulonate synthase [Sphaeroforma arctica JP610]|eukprot:XP_014150719.1 3-deoxy-7-phosphoheptulonate synthase [Sphaeroforma arctica JP610]